MSKKLEIIIGESLFEATMLDKLAPVTCATLSKYLPYEGQGTHVDWSGFCVYVPWRTVKAAGEKIPPEHETATIYGSAGDVAWNTTWNNELFICHGTSQYRWRYGPLVCNVFAKITENLEELDNTCGEMLFKGSKRVTLK